MENLLVPSETASSWVPVALSSDLPSATVMPARIPAGRLALWRSQSGHVSASADRCPHRGMSLSHGFVRGEALSCIYHGWSYSQSGQCLRIPAHPGLTPPEAIRAKTYPVAETDGVIWVSTGEPASQPPALAGFVPLRSLAAFAGVAAIETAAGATVNADGLLELAEGGAGIRLLLSAQGDGETLIHVLIAAGADPATRIAASRTVEGLRRTAENLQTKGIAP